MLIFIISDNEEDCRGISGAGSCRSLLVSAVIDSGDGVHHDMREEWSLLVRTGSLQIMTRSTASPPTYPLTVPKMKVEWSEEQDW